MSSIPNLVCCNIVVFTDWVVINERYDQLSPFVISEKYSQLNWFVINEYNPQNTHIITDLTCT